MTDIKLPEMHEGLIDLFDYLSLVGLSDETRESLIKQIEEYTLSAVRENVPSQQESAWLIEGDSCYWDGKSIDQGGTFTRNPNEALRFSRREDADIVKFWLLRKWSHALRTAEHVWLTDVPDSEGGKL